MSFYIHRIAHTLRELREEKYPVRSSLAKFLTSIDPTHQECTVRDYLRQFEDGLAGLDNAFKGKEPIHRYFLLYVAALKPSQEQLDTIFYLGHNAYFGRVVGGLPELIRSYQERYKDALGLEIIVEDAAK